MPSIVWKKDGNLTEYPIVTTNLSAINSSKRLEIRSDGVTYQEAGNYTCEVYNGADGLAAVFDTLEVICEYFPNSGYYSFHCTIPAMANLDFNVSFKISGTCPGLLIIHLIQSGVIENHYQFEKPLLSSKRFPLLELIVPFTFVSYSVFEH